MQTFTLQHMEERTPEQVVYPEQSSSLWRGAHAGASFLAGTEGHGGLMLKHLLFKDCNPWEERTLEQEKIVKREWHM